MSALLAALLLAATTPPVDPVGLRIHASDQAAQDLQGPLDGAWTLYGADGRALFGFQFVDPAGGRSPLQGAWRAGDAVGPFSSLRRTGRALVLDFTPRPGGPAVLVVLHQASGRRWAGRVVQDGRGRPATLRRD